MLETGQVPFGPVMVVWTALVVCFGSWGGLSTCIGARGGGSDADLSERLAENRRFEHVYLCAVPYFRSNGNCVGTGREDGSASRHGGCFVISYYRRYFDN